MMVLDHERLDVYHLSLDFWCLRTKSSKRCREGEAICPTSSCVRRHRLCSISQRELASIPSRTSDGTTSRHVGRRRSPLRCWTCALGSNYSMTLDTKLARKCWCVWCRCSSS